MVCLTASAWILYDVFIAMYPTFPLARTSLQMLFGCCLNEMDVGLSSAAGCTFVHLLLSKANCR